jgi:predicted RNA-binding protein with TRAM domain
MAGPAILPPEMSTDLPVEEGSMVVVVVVDAGSGGSGAT